MGPRDHFWGNFKNLKNGVKIQKKSCSRTPFWKKFTKNTIFLSLFSGFVLKNRKSRKSDPKFECFVRHNDPIFLSPKSMFWGGTFSTIFPKNIRGEGSDIFGVKNPEKSGFSPKMGPGKIFWLWISGPFFGPKILGPFLRSFGTSKISRFFIKMNI